jgi:hypothetical protein
MRVKETEAYVTNNEISRWIFNGRNLVRCIRQIKNSENMNICKDKYDFQESKIVHEASNAKSVL